MDKATTYIRRSPFDGDNSGYAHTYLAVQVTDYASQAAAFKAVFTSTRRIDLVHANAGIIERGSFFAKHDTGDEPPPQPMPSIGRSIRL